MTASQSLKIYEILLRHFNNDADARIIVQEIEQIVDNKFENRINEFTPKIRSSTVEKGYGNHAG